MKTFSAGLLKFLQTAKSYNRADLFAITLPNGSIIRSAASPYDITFNGNVFYSSRYGAWERGKITAEAAFDLRSNDMPLTVLAPGTIPFPAGPIVTSSFVSPTIDNFVTNSGTGLTTTVTGTPSAAGELALLIEANGSSSSSPSAPSPGSWTHIDDPNGASHSSMYAQLLSTGASITPSQTLSGSSDTWATVLIFLGSSTGSVITMPQKVTFVSGAFGAGNQTAAFASATTAGSGVLVILASVITTTPIAPTVTDTAGNVYSLVTKITSGAGASIAVLWSPNVPVGNPTMTFNLGSGSVSGTALAYEIAGIGNLPVITSIVNTSATLMTAAQLGLFDAAKVQVWTAYWPIGQLPNSYVAAWGVETKYAGFIKPSGSIGRSKLEFEVADPLYLLNQKLPRNVIQASCRHTLFDTNEFATYGTRSNCTLNPNSFKSGTMTVASGSTRQSLNTTSTLGQVAPYFTQGYVTFLTGQNAGLSFTIKQQTSTTHLLLAIAVPLPLAIGDTFTAFAGCDKLENTCNNKFSNLIHFGGTPFVPSPEVAI